MPTVLALREIAAGHIGPEILDEVDLPPPAPEPLPEIDLAASEARNKASCAMSFGSIIALIEEAASASAFTSSMERPLIWARP